MLGGDFNIDLNKPSNDLNQLEDLVLASGLTQLVEQGLTTRLRIVHTVNGIRVESSALDHIYSSESNLKLTLTNSISDHVFVQVAKPIITGIVRE